jgi:toxin ParE1/3/4
MTRIRQEGKGRGPRVYRIRWSARAEQDLEEIGDHIARDNPQAAERWVGKILDRTSKAAIAPFGGRVSAEFRQDNVREVFLRSYRIVYRVRDDEVQVVTVFEGHRLFPHDVDVHGDEP